MKSQAENPRVRARQDVGLVALACRDLQIAHQQIDGQLRTKARVAIEILCDHPAILPISDELLTAARLELRNHGRPSIETMEAVVEALRGFVPSHPGVTAVEAARRLRDARIAQLIDEINEYEPREHGENS